MRIPGSVLSALLLGGCASALPPGTPDLLLTNGRVYLGRDAGFVDTVAVRADRIVWVGNRDEAPPGTKRARRVIDLHGQVLLPGLHDVHIHPLGIVPPGGCDLDSAVLSLAGLVPRLRACIAAGDVNAAGWLMVSQWNFTSGNQPDATYPTMRAALDAVSRDAPVMLLGNDGHHGAVNSVALARARTPGGAVVGLDADTLRTHFASLRQYVGRDAAGAPNGYVNEGARYLFGAPAAALWELPPVAVLPDIARKLAANGITSVRDAAVVPAALPLYDALYASGAQTFRLTLALQPDFEEYRVADGQVDFDAMVSATQARRERYADHPRIRADTVKIFVDGVLEGDPLAEPPTLPNAARLSPYLQPRFGRTPDGQLRVEGYVDPGSVACGSGRAAAAADDFAPGFRAQYGFHPDQCAVSRGVLEHPVDEVQGFVAAFDAAGFTVHAHAIGDRAVRTAVEAFAALRGPLRHPHGLAHTQLIHPDDIPRIGALGLGMAFTYAWILPALDYDLTVVPFVDRVAGTDLYDPQNYSYRQSYPTRSLLAAGAVLTAGSDAPVDTREPRPFVNMQQAVTRADANGAVLNAEERLDIHTAVAAYTINGARALGQTRLTGKVAAGYKADLVVIDRDIFALAASGRAAEIGATRVSLTVFDGDIVYTQP